MSFRRFAPAIVAVALAATAPAVARAQAPNLGGTWELAVDRSSFGMMPAPQKSTLVVEQKEGVVKTTTSEVGMQGERTASMTLTTDGKESRNEMRPGQELVSVAKWDGGALAVTSKLQAQGNEITVNERWTLSPDGKALTIARKIATPMGELEMQLVYDKKS